MDERVKCEKSQRNGRVRRSEVVTDTIMRKTGREEIWLTGNIGKI
jgi:hypothetical protein